MPEVTAIPCNQDSANAASLSLVASTGGAKDCVRSLASLSVGVPSTVTSTVPSTPPSVTSEASATLSVSTCASSSETTRHSDIVRYSGISRSKTEPRKGQLCIREASLVDPCEHSPRFSSSVKSEGATPSKLVRMGKSDGVLNHKQGRRRALQDNLLRMLRAVHIGGPSDGRVAVRDGGAPIAHDPMECDPTVGIGNKLKGSDSRWRVWQRGLLGGRS